ncbi:MAG: hypothetical protein AB8B71_13360 [Paracoccaceae bacterium]
MTNTLALVLGLILLGGVAYDTMSHDGAGLLFLARKFTDLIEWLAFWR